MRRDGIAVAGCALALLFLSGCATKQVGLQRFAYAEPQMGVPFHIVLYSADRSSADAAAQAAFARIKQLNDILSDYDTDSELSRLSQTAGHHQAVRVSDDLWIMLSRSEQMARESGGAFDITCGPAVSHWRKARREKKLPDPEKLAGAMRAVGFEKLKLDDRNHTAELIVPYMRLDLGAIAKGYAADEGLKVLRQRGIARALVGGAGDMAAGGAPPGQRGWRIELAGQEDAEVKPKAERDKPPFVLIRNCGLATSGDLFQYVEIDGVRYSHIVDPHTGIGLTDHSLAVVIAEDGTTADSLSTAISVLGPEKGLELARAHRACARIIRKNGPRVELKESECFAERLVPAIGRE